jgi:density-regulated protein DRP1
VCSLPPEYCEFGSHFTKCKTWLEEEHPDLFQQYYSEGAAWVAIRYPLEQWTHLCISKIITDALTTKAAALSLTAASALEADTAKKEKKAAAKEDAEVKRKMASRVTIKRVERNKKKYVTAVMGLEAFGRSILQTVLLAGS